MAIKDRVASWFIRNIIIPKTEIIDKPGFIVCKTSPEKDTALRELFLPETLFADLETQVARALPHGKELLYSIGKRFGYSYASMSSFPRIDKVSKRDFLKFSYFLVRYIEGDCSNALKPAEMIFTFPLFIKLRSGRPTCAA